MWLYESSGGDLALASWTGRWQDQRNLEFYLQEGLVLRVLENLPSLVEDRLVSLCALFDSLFPL